MDPQWEPSSLFFLFFFYLNPHPSPISPSLSGSRLQSQSARPALAETHCGGADVSIDQEVCAPPIPTPTQTCTEARALAPEAPSTKTKVTWEEKEKKKRKIWQVYKERLERGYMCYLQYVLWPLCRCKHQQSKGRTARRALTRTLTGNVDI